MIFMVETDELKNILIELKDYLSKALAGECNFNLNDYESYIPRLSQTLIDSNVEKIEQLEKVIMKLTAFIQQDKVKNEISKSEFYSSMNAYFNEAGQIKAKGKFADLIEKFKSQIILFESFMKNKFPYDEEFFFTINENKGKLNKKIYTPEFMNFLDKCRNSNSGRKKEYGDVLQLIRALQFHASGNNENVLSNYTDLNEKNKKALRKLSNLGNNQLNKNVHNKINSIHDEIYNKIIYQFFKNKERRNIRKIAQLKRNPKSAEDRKIEKEIFKLFNSAKNYDRPEVEQKLKDVESIISHLN